MVDSPHRFGLGQLYNPGPAVPVSAQFQTSTQRLFVAFNGPISTGVTSPAGAFLAEPTSTVNRQTSTAYVPDSVSSIRVQMAAAVPLTAGTNVCSYNGLLPDFKDHYGNPVAAWSGFPFTII